MEKIDLNRKKKITQAINLVEELSWLLDSKKGIELREIPLLLRSLLEPSNASFVVNSKIASPNSNKSYLIGVLPTLFQDVDLFKSNIDLAEFAETVLRISINRAEKRSRYELIGLIVCEVTYINESDLTILVDALIKIAGSNDRLKQIKEFKKRANFSWNETIKTLSSS